jgi:hypothetical protein
MLPCSLDNSRNAISHVDYDGVTPSMCRYLSIESLREAPGHRPVYEPFMSHLIIVFAKSDGVLSLVTPAKAGVHTLS